MERVHCHRRASENSGGAAALLQRDVVRSRAPRIAPVMLDRRRSFAGEVLPECATQRDVDQLDAATDAEDRHAPLARGREEGQLEQVALTVDFAQVR